MRAAALSAGLGLLLIAAPARAAYDEPFPLPRSAFGSVGLIDMPSARMAPDGEISFTAIAFQNTQRYSLGFQALPWLDLSFRYTGLQHYDPDYPTYYDRSYGVRIRLAEEGEYRPAIVVGIRDLFGTGVYSGEYFAASKRLFEDLDVTAGIGWGRLSTADAFPNPFGKILHSFYNRSTNYGNGGTVNFGTFFHGPNAGAFGGVVWRSPIDNLSFVAEYSSDKYTQETQVGNFKPRMQVNLGAQYQLFDSVQIGVDWLYGRSIGVSLTFAGDPTKPGYPASIAPDPIDAQMRSTDEQLQALTGLMKPLQRPDASVFTRPRALTGLQPPLNIPAFAALVYGPGSAVTDVSLHGRTVLIATAARDIGGNDCMRYARDAVFHLSGIDEVVLAGGRNRTAQCATDAVPEAALWRSGARLADAAPPEPPQPLPPSGPDRAAIDDAAIEAIRTDMQQQMLTPDALAIHDGEAWVYYKNGSYGSAADANGRLIRVMLKDAPPDVEVFHLVSLINGMPAQQYDVLRAPMERALANLGGTAAIKEAVSLRAPALSNPVLSEGERGSYPRFGWYLAPAFRQSFFDPSNPIRVGLFATLGGEMYVTRHLSFSTSLEASIWNNLYSGKGTDSDLPHVRTDFDQYYKHGIDGMSTLQASYRFRLSPDINVLLKGGYLESMYGGAGGEILWHPENSRFAVGADMYEVWKRAYDRLFGFQQYHVFTGHVSVYYQSPWYGLNLHVMAGRYLAGDHGATFELTRRFSTGVELGAFATLTNVPFAKFGEGSFDKGLIIRIPFDWVLPIPSQDTYALNLRPVTRDGGARLSDDVQIYDELRRENYGEISQHWQDLIKP